MRNNFSLIEDMNHDIPHLTTEESCILTSNLSVKEVFAAIYQMEKNKATGPAGFPAEFYQKIVKLLRTI